MLRGYTVTDPESPLIRFYFNTAPNPAKVALMLEEFGVAWVGISLSKPGAIRSSRDVGVVLERDREDLKKWREHTKPAA